MLTSSSFNANLNENFNQRKLKSSLETIEKSESSLFAAVKKGNFKIVCLLLAQKSICVNSCCCFKHFYKNEDKCKILEKTAFHIAIEKNHSRIINLLINNEKVDVNSKIISKSSKKHGNNIEIQEKTVL